MIKEGAAVIDVGINRVQDPVTAKPKLVGDVDFEGMGSGFSGSQEYQSNIRMTRLPLY